MFTKWHDHVNLKHSVGFPPVHRQNNLIQNVLKKLMPGAAFPEFLQTAAALLARAFYFSVQQTTDQPSS